MVLLIPAILFYGCSGSSSSKDEPDVPEIENPEPDSVIFVQTPDESGSLNSVSIKNGRLYNSSGELSLWGFNFQTCLSWEYNNRLKKRGVPETEDALKTITDNNLDQVKRLGANLIRCHLTPADFTDAQGNLVETPYLKVLDYMVQGARKRGIYVTLTLINHMSNAYIKESVFNNCKKQEWVMDPDVVGCSKTYVEQLMKRVNPYTNSTYASEKAIAYWELINEPSFYEYDGSSNPLPATGAVRDAYNAFIEADALPDSKVSYNKFRKESITEYIDTMNSVIRNSGGRQPIIWSHNWPKYRNSSRMDIFEGVLASDIDGVSLCSYPGQNLVSSDYWNNPKDLTDYDFTTWFQENGYDWLNQAEYSGKAKVIYEFETFFNQSSYLYPIMSLFFRSYGFQAASMWTYTMQEYAQYHAGSHFLSLTCTPKKAASFMVAGKIFKDTQPGIAFPENPNEQVASKYAISKSRDLSIYSDEDYLYYSGDVTSWNSISISDEVKHVAGVGNSKIVKYSGSGLFFIDETTDGLYITLEPNYKWLQEPWNSKAAGQVTSLDYYSKNVISIYLKNWTGGKYAIYRISETSGRKIGEYSSLEGLSLPSGEYLVKKILIS